MNLTSKIRVAVLRGGPSESYENSLKTGGHLLSILREMPEAYEPVDIFISKEGEWHLAGLSSEPHEVLKHIDVAWNALHGSYGEDGQVQRVLEGMRIPFIGSSAVASALSQDKDMAKRIYQMHSIPTPAHELILEEDSELEDKLVVIFRTYLHPVIVKPANKSNSLGVRMAHTFKELRELVRDTFIHSRRVMVEEYIKGDEASCVAIEGAKGERIYTLLPTITGRGDVGRQIEEMTKKAHEALGLRHYSISDFVVTPRGKIYILETNSSPVFHPESLLHESLLETGWRSRDFVDHVLKLVV